MLVIAIVPVLAAVIGLLIYALASNSKLVEIGRLTYFAGILVTLLAFMRHVITLR